MAWHRVTEMMHHPCRVSEFNLYASVFACLLYDLTTLTEHDALSYLAVFAHAPCPRGS